MKFDVVLTDDDRKRITDLFGGNTDRYLDIVARSGADELLAMAAGKTVPTTMPDLRQYRIFRLMANGVAVEEAASLVALLFKVRLAVARRYVADAAARYTVELAADLNKRIAALLGDAKWADDRWEVELPAGILEEKVLEVANATDLPTPERAGRGQIYKLADETYQYVRANYKLPRRKAK